MESALEAGVAKVVHVSTAAVYGNAEWPIREETPFGTSCASTYAQTKREGDELVWKMHSERGLPVVGIFPGAVLGANDPKAAGRYVANFALGRMPAQVLTRCVFPFVHVRDVCRAITLALDKEANVGGKYLIVGQNMTFGKFNRMISDVSGAKLPVLKLPDWLTVSGSHLLTVLGDLIGRRPLWDMSVDQIALMKLGGEFDGGKATRELGLTYTPIRLALEEAIASLS
jgi:dihydroflavonol-4-reductase